MAGVSTAVVYNRGWLALGSAHKTLYGISGKAPVSGFFQLYDSSSAPTIGGSSPTIPVLVLPFFGNSVFDYNFFEGVSLTNGLYLVATAHEATADPSATYNTYPLSVPMTATIRYS